MFDQSRPAIAAFLLGPILMAAIFGAVTALGGTPVSPETYGRLVYSVPALAWSGAQMGLASIAMAGVARNRPALAFVGLAGLALLFLFFAGMAIQAGAPGTLLVAMAIGTAPICMVYAWWAWGAWRG
jgi:hypothetical protein